MVEEMSPALEASRHSRIRSLALLAGALFVIAAIAVVAASRDTQTAGLAAPEADVTISDATEVFVWDEGGISIDLFRWQDNGWLHIASGNSSDAEIGIWGPTQPLDRFRKMALLYDVAVRLPSNASQGTYRICFGNPSADCINVMLTG